MHCPSCGRESKAGERYCAFCGAALSVSSSSSSVPSGATIVQEVAPGKGGLDRRVALIAVVLIVLAVTGGVLAVALSRPPSSPGNGSSNNNNNSNGGGTSPTAHNQVSYYKSWKDPTENAFSVTIPKGWTATGGIGRDYFDPQFYFDAKDPSGTMNVFFRNTAAPLFQAPETDPLSCVNYGTGVPPQCVPGSYYVPISSLPRWRFYIWQYVNAQDFARTFMLPQLQHLHPTATLISTTPRPDLAHQSVDLIIGQTSTGADALFSYTDQGVLYNVGIVVQTGAVTIVTSGSPFTVWWASYMGASAPVSDFSQGKNVTRIYSRMLPTVRINPVWLQHELQNMAQRSMMVQQTFDRIRADDYHTFLSASESDMRVAHGWMNALGGTEDVKSPSGDVYSISSEPGANYTWGNNLGDIVRTSDYVNPDPSNFQPFTQCGVQGC